MNQAEQQLSNEDLTMWCSHFDHHHPDLKHEHVYQIYEHLRETCPITRSEEHGGFWVVSRYADIVAVLMDPITFCSGKEVHIPRQEGQMEVVPIDFDPLACEAGRKKDGAATLLNCVSAPFLIPL